MGTDLIKDFAYLFSKDIRKALFACKIEPKLSLVGEQVKITGLKFNEPPHFPNSNQATEVVLSDSFQFHVNKSLSAVPVVLSGETVIRISGALKIIGWSIEINKIVRLVETENSPSGYPAFVIIEVGYVGAATFMKSENITLSKVKSRIEKHRDTMSPKGG